MTLTHACNLPRWLLRWLLQPTPWMLTQTSLPHYRQPSPPPPLASSCRPSRALLRWSARTVAPRHTEPSCWTRSVLRHRPHRPWLSVAPHRWHSRSRCPPRRWVRMTPGSPFGVRDEVRPRAETGVISIRRMSLGAGYRYLMESVAVGDGARHAPRSDPLLRRVRHPSGHLPGRRAGRPGRRHGVEAGSEVTEEHLFRMLGMCADPVTGQPLGRQPNRSHLSLAAPGGERLAPSSTDRSRPASGRSWWPGSRPRSRPGRAVSAAGGRVRSDVLAVQERLGGVGGGRRGDQGGHLRLPPPGHRHRPRLRRAGGVPLPFGDQRGRPGGHRRGGRRRVHPLGQPGRRPPAARPCRRPQPGPVDLGRQVADAGLAGPVQGGRHPLRAAPRGAVRPADRRAGLGVGRPGPAPLRRAPLRGDRRARGADGRVHPAAEAIEAASARARSPSSSPPTAASRPRSRCSVCASRRP